MATTNPIEREICKRRGHQEADGPNPQLDPQAYSQWAMQSQLPGGWKICCWCGYEYRLVPVYQQEERVPA